MGSRQLSFGMVAPLVLFGMGAATIVAWRGGHYASLVLALLMAGWLAALMFWRRMPIASDTSDAEGAGEDRLQGALLRAVVEQLPVALTSIGRDNRVRALNRAARDLFGPGDVVVDPPSELAGGAPRLTTSGRTYRIDRIEGPSASGIRMIAVLVDVENEERMVEARATRELLEVLSHEVMNAATPVASLAESALSMLGEDPAPISELRDAIGTLARRTGGLLDFTAAYRELARLPEPTLIRLSLSTVFNDLSRMFAARWAERVVLSQTVPGGLCVKADRDQLTQALWALLQNAAEAALDYAAEPCVTLVAHGDDHGDDIVMICVSDNGSGIAPALRQRVFRPFVTTKAKGSGIGLSLAQQIALGHGGMLRLLPPDGNGTQFEIRLRGGVSQDLSKDE